MAMFQQYQNGVQPVTGMAEAGANIGNMYMRGIGQMSEGLSKGIQEYYKNSALNDQATEEGHAVGQQLAFFHQMASMSPENAALLPMLDEQIETMKKVPTMSLTQKLGALNGAKATLSQFGTNLQLNQMMQQQRATNDLLNFKPKADQVTLGVTLDNTPFDPKFSPQENVDKFLLPALQQLKQSGVNVGEDNKVISDYLAGIKANLAKSTDKSGNPIDPTTQSVFSEQLDKYLAYRNNEMTDDSGVTDYAKEAGLYDASSTSTNAYVTPKPVAPAESASTTSEDLSVENFAKSAAENINKQREGEIESKKAEASARDMVRASVLGVVSNGKAPTLSNMYLELDKVKQKAGLSYDGISWVDKKGNNADVLANQIDDEYKSLLDRMGFSHLYKGMSNPSNEAEIARQLKTNPELQAKVLQAIPESKARTQALASEAQKLSKQAPTTSSDVLSQNKQNEISLNPVLAESIVAGRKDFERPASPEEQKQQAMQWFKDSKQYGYIPSAFNAIWEQQHPESKLQVIEKDGYTFYSDGKGEFKLVPKEKNTMSPEEAAKYGVRAYNGEEVAAGSGIYAKGVVLGEKPAEFKKELTSAGEAMRQIDALKRLMVNTNGRSLSPVARAEAQKYVAFLKSAIRPELFPSGRVAEWEQIILDQLVPNPTGIFTLDESTTKSLDVLREQVANNIKNSAANRGIEVRFSSANQVSSLAQDARIANREARPPQPIRR